MKRFVIAGCLVVLNLMAFSAAAEENGKIHDIGEVQVSAQGDSRDIRLAPSETVIVPDDVDLAGSAQNVTDLILKLPMFDNRATSDLVPDVDNLYMRGFGSNRFTTAMDGMTLRKTGGRKNSNIVDYGLLPPWLFGKIEVLGGPHSALYPGKSIGGVLSLVPKEPVRQESPVPKTRIDLDAQSYGTQNHNMSTRGSAGNATYDLGYQMYRTDGYLRHTGAAMDTFFARLGYLTPSDGFVTFSLSHTDTDKDTTVVNDPAETDYDPDYPVVTETTFRTYQAPTWDSDADSYRFALKQPSPFGTWRATAYYSEEMRDYYNEDWVDANDPAQGTVEGKNSFDTTWTQQGGKLQDTLNLGPDHTLVLGSDLEQCYDDGNTLGTDKNKRIDIIGAFFQDSWRIVPGLTLRAGIRFEDVSIAVSNLAKNGSNYITGQGDFIDRDWNEWIPKSFLTWELDSLAPSLRDTTVSAGVSKIWRAPDYHGDYNPQGRPAGAFLEPEHGMGCDLVFTRRLASDITLKLDYGYAEIKDYIATNSSFAEYTPSGSNPVTPGEEYKDYKINLDKVVQHTVETQVAGHIIDDLSFYLGYAFLDMDSKGGEPAGEKECDRRARHRVTAGLSYELVTQTKLIADYTFQDDQIVENYDEVTEEFHDVAMDNWQRVDMAVEQTLFEDLGFMDTGSVKVYVKNVFDEDYINSNGYPATDRTYGASLSLVF